MAEEIKPKKLGESGYYFLFDKKADFTIMRIPKIKAGIAQW